LASCFLRYSDFMPLKFSGTDTSAQVPSPRDFTEL
jgi:hypothetical protein